MDETHLGSRLLDFCPVTSFPAAKSDVPDDDRVSNCDRWSSIAVQPSRHPVHTAARCTVGYPDLHISLSQMNEPHILTVLPTCRGQAVDRTGDRR